MIIEVKGIEQYFPLVLFIMLYKLVLTLRFGMKSLSVTIQINKSEYYSPVVLFIMLYKVVQAVQSVDETLKCDHSNESY